jgi:hypothetical protein
MEVKTPIFRRYPPGDRWVEVSTADRVYQTLTEALEYYFQQHGTRQYYIDAGEGIVYKIDTREDPAPVPRKYSLYGDY